MPASRRSAMVVLSLSFLLAGCGGDDPAVDPSAPSTDPGATTTEATGTTEATEAVGEALDAPPVTDAEALRDHLLALAEQNVTEGASTPDPHSPYGIPDFGITSAWIDAYPDLGWSGAANPVTPETVTLFAFQQDDKDVPSESNPYLIQFWIVDTEGRCASGRAVGYPVPSTFEAVPVAPVVDGANTYCSEA